ncbi:MAG: hypothetical protein OEU36_02545 [Gammaproteobacteria bacterium]|nr:hypothetical protein [Gammaproteobacteria bacterium]
MKDVLERHLNQEVGINLERPFRVESALLIKVEDDYFTIQDHKNDYIHHFSYASIVQVVENPDGVEIGGLFSHKKRFPVVIKVGHLVEHIPA